MMLTMIPMEWQITGWSVIGPLTIVVVCHILYPIVINTYLMVFSY